MPISNLESRGPKSGTERANGTLDFYIFHFRNLRLAGPERILDRTYDRLQPHYLWASPQCHNFHTRKGHVSMAILGWLWLWP